MSRRERPYLFYGATRAICSTCFMVCDAKELIEGDKVFLWKRCLEHGVAADVNDSLRLVFFERWADRDALLAHFRVPASREFAAQVARLAARPPELHVYDAGSGAIALR